MTWNALDAHLDMLRLTRGDDLLGRVLHPIGHAIRLAGNRAEQVHERVHPDDVDFFVDEECDLIEGLLGAAFVTCQTRITEIVSRVQHLDKYCQKQGIVFTRPFLMDKPSILARGAPLSGVPTVTDVQAIDALANYFKHREEWPAVVDWTRLTGLSARTATVVMELGLQSGSTGNLRTGAKALGNTEFHNVSLFDAAISTWAERVVEDVVRAIPQQPDP